MAEKNPARLKNYPDTVFNNMVIYSAHSSFSKNKFAELYLGQCRGILKLLQKSCSVLRPKKLSCGEKKMPSPPLPPDI